MARNRLEAAFDMLDRDYVSMPRAPTAEMLAAGILAGGVSMIQLKAAYDAMVRAAMDADRVEDAPRPGRGLN